MDKRIRQYCALIIAILAYYLIHERAYYSLYSDGNIPTVSVLDNFV